METEDNKFEFTIESAETFMNFIKNIKKEEPTLYINDVPIGKVIEHNMSCACDGV